MLETVEEEEEEEEDEQPKQTVGSAVWADRRDREEWREVRGRDCISSGLTPVKKQSGPRRAHILSFVLHTPLDLIRLCYYHYHSFRNFLIIFLCYSFVTPFISWPYCTDLGYTKRLHVGICYIILGSLTHAGNM